MTRRRLSIFKLDRKYAVPGDSDSTFTKIYDVDKYSVSCLVLLVLKVRI